MTAQKSYSEKLRDPRWQKKRLEIMQRDDFACRLCGDKKSTLHIHHKEYRVGHEPWEYEEENLVTYCETCHSLVEYLKPIDVLGVIKLGYEPGDHQFYLVSTIIAIDDKVFVPSICLIRYYFSLMEWDVIVALSETRVTEMYGLIEAAKNKLKSNGKNPNH